MRRTEIDEVVKLITDWAIDQKVSKGGYAPVELQEIHDLNYIILKLLELKYERDPDGDLPVDFELVDRTRHYNPFFNSFGQLEYPSNARNNEGIYDTAKLEEGLDTRLMILNIAMNEVKMISRYIATVRKQNAQPS